ncbi:MAG: YciI family protein [Pseudomonadota bacterium]|nr:YciI family protein [Pseudomonadota bacterium]
MRCLIMAMRTPQFQQPIIEPHMQYLEKLREQGVLELAGPFADKTGGAYLVAAENLEAAQAIALKDPFHTSGSFVLTVYEWQAV